MHCFVTQDASCSCGQHSQDDLHFFFERNINTGHRAQLHQTIISHAPFNLRILLYGGDNVNYDINKEIMYIVQVELTPR